MKLTDKRILVTGADGFIGSHLTETLLDMGCQVRALSLYNSFNDWGWLEVIQGRDNLEVVCGDVRDPHFCKQITQEIDVIFHLAALIAIPYSYVAPDSYVDINIKGTLNICQAARENGCIRVIPTIITQIAAGKNQIQLGDVTPTPVSPTPTR
jgi:nucleoside-diphosphate-sugar epimerase